MSNKKVFVMMPFLDELNEVYDYLIKESLEKEGYSVFRVN